MEAAPIDDYRDSIPRPLPAARVRALSQPAGWISVGTIALNWALLVGAAWLCWRHFSPLLYVATVIWIGARQHAFLVLMHDASHYRLLASKPWNDWVCDLFLSWPIFITTHGFRVEHFAHHRATGSDDDPSVYLRKANGQWLPEWDFPQPWPRMLRTLAMDLSGLNSLEFAIRLQRTRSGRGLRAETLQSAGPPPHRPGVRWIRLAYYATLAAVLTWTGGWKIYFLFWLVPGFTWLKAILRLRSIAEHHAVPARHFLSRSRTTVPNLLERWLLVPCSISYHVEHHLYPSIPFFRLPALHRELQAIPEVRAHAHVKHGYVQTIRECVATANPSASAEDQRQPGGPPTHSRGTSQ